MNKYKDCAEYLINLADSCYDAAEERQKTEAYLREQFPEHVPNAGNMVPEPGKVIDHDRAVKIVTENFEELCDNPPNEPGKWIPVTERLPVNYEGKYYHTTGHLYDNPDYERFIVLCKYNGEKFYSVDSNMYFPYVTHYCETNIPPLPPAPKE